MLVLKLSGIQNTLKALLFVDKFYDYMYYICIENTKFVVYRRKENIEGDQRGVGKVANIGQRILTYLQLADSHYPYNLITLVKE